MPNLDNPLNRAATIASREIVPILRNTLIGRRFASINPLMKGDGKTSFEITSVSDLSDGFVQWNLPSGNEFSDSIRSELHVVNVPILYKKFEVRMEDLLAWDNRGAGEEYSLNSIAAVTASRKVAEQEEQMIFNGWAPDGSNYVVKGFSQAAGNVITGGSIATAGTMYQYVVDAISALEADTVFGDAGSYNLAVTHEIKSAILGKRYDNGDREYQAIKEILGNGQIYTTPYLPAGTALITPVDSSRQYFEYLTPVDYRIVFKAPEFEGLSPVTGISYELFCPHYLRENANGTTDAVAKITGLTA